MSSRRTRRWPRGPGSRSATGWPRRIGRRPGSRRRRAPAATWPADGCCARQAITTITAAKLAALHRNSTPALVAASSAPPIAGPTARARFWFTEPSEIACVRSSSATSSGCSVCQVGAVRPGPCRRANSSARRDHGASAPAIVEHAERGGGEQHHGLRGDQESAPVDQVADGAGEDREQHDRQARRGLDQRDVDRRRGERQHQPLRADGLHPVADVADELSTPHGGVDAVPERCPGRNGFCRGGGRHRITICVPRMCPSAERETQSLVAAVADRVEMNHGDDPDHRCDRRAGPGPGPTPGRPGHHTAAARPRPEEARRGRGNAAGTTGADVPRRLRRPEPGARARR